MKATNMHKLTHQTKRFVAVYSVTIVLSFLVDWYHSCTHFCTVVSQAGIRRDLCMYSSDELFQHSENKHQNDTRVNTETFCYESTYITLSITWQNESINDDKNDDLYTSFPCLTRSVFVLLMTSQSIADDSTMIKRMWRDHVNSDI